MSYKAINLHNRQHTILSAIAQTNQSLLDVYRQAKYEKMAESPYSFLRGTNHLFWEDIYNDWRLSLFGGNADTHTWLQGDAHLYNFGAFANYYYEVIYGFDDFDDAIVGDYQYDLWRLVISLVLDCRENGHFHSKKITKAVKKLGKAYMATILNDRHNPAIKEIHFTKENTDGKLKKFLKKVQKKETRHKMLEKWTTFDENNKRVFNKEAEKLSPLSDQEWEMIVSAFPQYRETLTGEIPADDDRYFKIKDIAQRLWAGTGSLGTPRYYILIEGDALTAHDDIILDVKRQETPAAYDQMKEEERKAYHSVFSHEGDRHAQAFRAIAEHPDQYLGWMELPNGVYSVRERSPFKEDFPTDKLDKSKDLYEVAEQWGIILATEHKRGGYALNQSYLFEDAMEAKILGREKTFIHFLVDVAFQYADCVEQDYNTFLAYLNEEIELAA
ncbi:Protein of unknown function DUF2252 [Halothece sp. PCC 7418]|uniref:DUF2252 domain-containing protein n=1 Tax=Halothece sp. (strain PCC 7418) TaxID=65093 RepID=UPI0002A05F8C|nr:DUF2252 family protein [Halothece sp. PCC 7418]AFZ43210.1 Protein of unknown function DUF2252 [Halothece sp. PCC 7418]